MNIKGFSKIMTERFETFNHFVMNMDRNDMPIGLYYGKMGLCVYFFEIGKITSQETYTAFAELLLDEVIEDLPNTLAVDIETGLSGICLAINYLIEKKFIEGDPNSIFKDCDGRIMHSLLFNKTFDEEDTPNIGSLILRLGILNYLSKRLENDNIAEDEKFIMQNIIIESINKIEEINFDKNYEPVFFSIVQYFIPKYLQFLLKIYKQDFYNYKIDRVVINLSQNVLSSFPFLQGHRLLLGYWLYKASKTWDIREWESHSQELINSVCVNREIDEFRNKNIMYNNGLAGFSYLLKHLNGNINTYSDKLKRRIETSVLWEDLYYNHDRLKRFTGLYNGISGLFLTYMNLSTSEKTILDEMY